MTTLELVPSEFVSVSFHRNIRWEPVVIGTAVGAALGVLAGSGVHEGEVPPWPVVAIAGGAIGFLGGVIWSFPGTKTVRCAP